MYRSHLSADGGTFVYAHLSYDLHLLDDFVTSQLTLKASHVGLHNMGKKKNVIFQ